MQLVVVKAVMAAVSIATFSMRLLITNKNLQKSAKNRGFLSRFIFVRFLKIFVLQKGPQPMQLVVVSAVMAAVSIATNTSTALRLMAAQAFSFSFSKIEPPPASPRRGGCCAEFCSIGLGLEVKCIRNYGIFG